MNSAFALSSNGQRLREKIVEFYHALFVKVDKNLQSVKPFSNSLTLLLIFFALSARKPVIISVRFSASQSSSWRVDRLRRCS
jgi:hypothetical protein